MMKIYDLIQNGWVVQIILMSQSDVMRNEVANDDGVVAAHNGASHSRNGASVIGASSRQVAAIWVWPGSAAHQAGLNNAKHQCQNQPGSLGNEAADSGVGWGADGGGLIT